jgi:hypothetical protein
MLPPANDFELEDDSARHRPAINYAPIASIPFAGSVTAFRRTQVMGIAANR